MWWLAGNQAVDQPPTALSLGCAAGQSAALGLCMGQLASAPGAHPPDISGVGAQLGFQVWVPSRGFSCWPPTGVSVVSA